MTRIDNQLKELSHNEVLNLSEFTANRLKRINHVKVKAAKRYIFSLSPTLELGICDVLGCPLFPTEAGYNTV